MDTALPELRMINLLYQTDYALLLCLGVMDHPQMAITLHQNILESNHHEVQGHVDLEAAILLDHWDQQGTDEQPAPTSQQSHHELHGSLVWSY